jgi:hypothetical protein
MSTDKRYNGWTNYETWCVKLWLDNDQETYNYWYDMAMEAWHDNDKELEPAAHVLRKQLKDEINEANPLAEDASMFSDLLSAALSEVNWYEIAETYLEDLDEDE